VSLPHFSRLQHDREALQKTVASCIHIVMLTAMPALLALAACSDYVLAVVGPEWEPGADALKLLCIVGIVKGLVHFTGPLLFAVARPLSRALMLWAIAAVNLTVIVAAGLALEAASEKEQLLGMSAARALVSLAVVVPLNLVIIKRLAGLRARTLVPWALPPFAAGIGAIAVVQGVSATGLLDGVGPIVALAIAGGLAMIVALAILLALEPRARAEVHQMRRSLIASRRTRPLTAADDAVTAIDGIDGSLEDLDAAELARADR
jgi:O-antigen/teichoic acid export membrane protein